MLTFCCVQQADPSSDYFSSELTVVLMNSPPSPVSYLTQYLKKKKLLHTCHLLLSCNISIDIIISFRFICIVIIVAIITDIKLLLLLFRCFLYDIIICLLPLNKVSMPKMCTSFVPLKSVLSE